jgi:hypothetical protein
VNENLIGFTIAYSVIAFLAMLIMICGIGNRWEEKLVVKHGLYRGYTVVVLECILRGVFWLPIVMVYWIRGLIRGD